MIGIDALPETLEKIRSGEIMGSVLQDAQTQGQAIVAMAKNLADGKDPLEGQSLNLIRMVRKRCVFLQGSYR